MKNHEFGNKDQKEKSRELTEAEQKRLERFNKLSEDMTSKGYRRTELTVSIVSANIFGVVLLIPLLVLSFVLLILLHDDISFDYSPLTLAVGLVILAVLIVVHELIHGASWAIFAEHHFKDIKFGFMKQYLTPYCTCCVPLSKGQYIFGALMPLVILGIIPMAVGIAAGSFSLTLLGIVMTDSASGDIMIVWNILRYKSEADDIVYIDHPTQAGGVIFER